jgi:hypothetical protein
MKHSELRQRCQEAGVKITDVKAMYQFLRDVERDAQERPNAVRQAAWETCTSKGCHPFWRHGFEKRWGKIYHENDVDALPFDYDRLAQIVASYFPEYDTDDGTERLSPFSSAHLYQRNRRRNYTTKPSSGSPKENPISYPRKRCGNSKRPHSNQERPLESIGRLLFF